MVDIFFDGFLERFRFGSGYGHFIIFEEIIGFGAVQNTGGFGYEHVECEFNVDFIVFFVDFEQKVGSRSSLLFLLLHLFDHFLSKA